MIVCSVLVWVICKVMVMLSDFIGEGYVFCIDFRFRLDFVVMFVCFLMEVVECYYESFG